MHTSPHVCLFVSRSLLGWGGVITFYGLCPWSTVFVVFCGVVGVAITSLLSASMKYITYVWRLTLTCTLTCATLQCPTCTLTHVTPQCGVGLDGGVGWAKNVLALVYLLHIFFACATHLGWVWVVGWVGQITSLLLRTCYKLTKLPATLRYHLIDAIGHKNFCRLRATLCCFLLYFLNNFQLR